MIVKKLGSGGPVAAVVACVHGDESLGMAVLQTLCSIELNAGTLLLVVANDLAYHRATRFVDCDLNRCFPGKSLGLHEEVLAHNLRGLLAPCDYVVDIHTTTAKTEPFTIVRKRSLSGMMSALGLKHSVFIPTNVIGKTSLIDYVKNGFSIEFPATARLQVAKQAVLSFLGNLGMISFGMNSPAECRFYEVFGALPKFVKSNPGMTNFRECCWGSKCFFPVFYGEKSYLDIECLMARRLANGK